jgi:hypothetical protein
MTQTNENVEASPLGSKFNRIFLTLVAVFLVFIGPTYIPYLMTDTLKIDYIASVGIGAVLFILGIVMLVYLIRKKVIT